MNEDKKITREECARLFKLFYQPRRKRRLHYRDICKTLGLGPFDSFDEADEAIKNTLAFHDCRLTLQEKNLRSGSRFVMNDGRSGIIQISPDDAEGYSSRGASPTPLGVAFYGDPRLRWCGSFAAKSMFPD